MKKLVSYNKVLVFTKKDHDLAKSGILQPKGIKLYKKLNS